MDVKNKKKTKGVEIINKDGVEFIAPEEEKKFLKEFNEWLSKNPEAKNSDAIKDLIVKIFRKNKNAEMINAGMNLKNAISDIEIKFKGMTFDVLVYPRDMCDDLRKSRHETRH